MSDANFEVCLLTSPVREVIEELRAALRPLRALHHEMLESIEADYSEGADALLLRLKFSKSITETRMQQRLVRHLGDLGLQIILPQNLSPFEREKFDAQLQEQYGVRIQRYPSARTPSVLPGIFDALEAHLTTMEARRFTSEIDAEPCLRSLATDRRHARSLTQDALDLVIAELVSPTSLADGSRDLDDVLLDEARRATTCEAMQVKLCEWPVRAETFGALDEMIENLPSRATTLDALDDFIEELRQ